MNIKNLTALISALAVSVSLAACGDADSVLDPAPTGTLNMNLCGMCSLANRKMICIAMFR